MIDLKMKKMLLIEHLTLVFVVVTVAYLVFLFAGLFAQLLDFDHTCDNCNSLSGRVSLLLQCGKAYDLKDFKDPCYHLHRGIFHDIRLFYVEVVVVIFLVGLVFGHGLHLMADDYDLFGLKWLISYLRSFL